MHNVLAPPIAGTAGAVFTVIASVAEDMPQALVMV
jgi:hypothetical protein